MCRSENVVQGRVKGSKVIKHAHQKQAARKIAGPHSAHPVNAAIEQTRCVGIYAASRRSCAVHLHRNARVLPQGLSLAARRRQPAPEICGCGLVCCRPLPRPPVLELRLLQLDYCRCCARGCSHRTACAEAADDTMRLNQLPQSAGQASHRRSPAVGRHSLHANRRSSYRYICTYYEYRLVNLHESVCIVPPTLQ